MTAEDAPVPTRAHSRPRAGWRTLAPYALAVVVFVAAALVSAPAMRGVLGALGALPAPHARAWVQQPGAVDQGIRPGAPLHVVVVPSGTGAVGWTALSAARVLARGEVPGTPGRAVAFEVPTAGARHRTWLVVAVSGIPVPLKVWVL